MTSRTKKNSAPDFVIFVVTEALSDKSEVYNVIFGDLKFAAVTRVDAEELAEKFRDAVEEHTVSTAGTVYE